MKANRLGVEWIYGPEPKRPAGKVSGVVTKVRSSRNFFLVNPTTKVWFEDGQVERFKGAPGLPGPNGPIPEIPTGENVTVSFNSRHWILRVEHQ